MFHTFQSHRLLHQLFGEVDEPQADQRRRVVDQRIDAAELVKPAAHDGVGDAGFAEIACEGQDALVGALLQVPRRAPEPLLLNVASDDIGAFLGQPPGYD